jgi:hypothetical protein
MLGPKDCASNSCMNLTDRPVTPLAVGGGRPAGSDVPYLSVPVPELVKMERPAPIRSVVDYAAGR